MCPRYFLFLIWTTNLASVVVVTGQVTTSSDCIRHIQSYVPTSGIIESPGFPQAYRSGIDCTYNFTSSPSSVIHITFLTFDLAPVHDRSRQCLSAYVIVIVIDRQGREHVGERLCGQNLPRKLQTMQPTLRIQFVTNVDGGDHIGFRIQYEMLSESAIPEPLSFINEEDKDLTPACGGRTQLAQLTGEIISPGFPLTFPRNCTCHWLIRVEPQQRIYIRIALLHLSPILTECDRASLTIMDGYKHEISTDRRTVQELIPDPLEARFCGSQSHYTEDGMKSYLSSGNRLIVRLVTTDRPSSLSQGERVGFKIIWTAVEGLVGEVTTHPSGIQPTASVASNEQQSQNSSSDECDQFVCKGGQICIEQGQGACTSRSQLCIHSSLVCNGIPNCVEGDYSDEQHCYSREIVIVTSTGLVAILIIIFTCICCDQIHKRRRLRQMIRQRRQQNGTSTSRNPPLQNNNNSSDARSASVSTITSDRRNTHGCNNNNNGINHLHPLYHPQPPSSGSITSSTMNRSSTGSGRRAPAPPNMGR